MQFDNNYKSYYIVADFELSFIKGSFFPVDSEKGRLTFDQAKANLLADMEENAKLFKEAVARVKKLKKKDVQ